MAVFSKNDELSRQRQHVPMEQAEGVKKAALAAMGYKATGEQNTWGKIQTHIPIVGGISGAVRHGAARAVAGKADKSDFAKVLKSQDSNVIQSGVADLKLGLEVAKVVGTGGAGGLSGGASSLTDSALSGSTSSVASKALGSTGTDVATQALTSGEGGAGNMLLNNAGGFNPDFDPEIMKESVKSFQEKGGNLDMVQKGQEELSKQNNMTLQDQKKILDEETEKYNQSKSGKFLEGVEKFDKLAGDYGPIVGELAESVGSKVARDKEAKEAARKEMGQTRELESLEDYNYWN